MNAVELNIIAIAFLVTGYALWAVGLAAKYSGSEDERRDRVPTPIRVVATIAVLVAMGFAILSLVSLSL